MKKWWEKPIDEKLFKEQIGELEKEVAELRRRLPRYKFDEETSKELMHKTMLLEYTVEVLHNQIPKMVKHCNNGYISWGECPICSHQVGFYDRFCRECGHRLSVD